MKNKLKILLSTAGFLFLLMISFLHYNRGVEGIALSRNINEMMELTTRQAELYNLAFHEKIKMVRSLASVLNHTQQVEEIKPLIDEYAKVNEMIIGFIYENGNGYSCSGEELKISDSMALTKLFTTEVGASDPVFDKATGDRVIYMYSGFTDKQMKKGTVFTVVKLDDIYSDAYTPLYEGEGISYAIDSTGEIFAGPLERKEYQINYNILDGIDYSKNNVSEKARFLDALSSGLSGNATFSISGTNLVYTYVTIPNTKDWFVVSVVNKQVLLQSAKKIFGRSIVLCIVITLLVLAIVSLFGYLSKKLKKEKEKIEKIDDITGHLNFSTFRELAKETFAEQTDRDYALLTFDIKDFRYFNEIYGYEEGDHLLHHIAHQIQKYELNIISFSRMNADNFVCLVAYKDEKTLKKQFKEFIKNISCKQGDIHFYAGVYCIDSKKSQQPDFNRMLDRANMARSIAKKNQEQNCVFYEETMYVQELENQILENEQESALKKGQFTVYLQPKISTQDERCQCAEALVRWEHPMKGIISPAKFIPLFEKNQFIIKLDRYVFEQCCIMVQNWIANECSKISVSINVSKVQVFRKDFLPTYTDLKQKYCIPDGVIELEFTESIFFENMQYLSDIIRELQKNGFICSIDDFGKGYSSFGALKDLPFDIIKIDGEFFANRLKSQRERVIVSCIVNMAKDLHMRTVAEGVETLEEVNYLKDIRCDLIQGYIYSKPLPMKLFEEKYIHN